jgi:hypothetical protein
MENDTQIPLESLKKALEMGASTYSVVRQRSSVNGEPNVDLGYLYYALI